MTNFKGFFELQTKNDLLKKLEFDFSRLQQSPLDRYTAFDFFVTAYHMLDWTYPGYANSKVREAKEGSEILLQVCSHIANGAKHFKAEAARHQSVAGSRFEKGAFDPNVFQNDAFDVGRLLVELDGDAATKFGPSIGVMDLAVKLVEFWRKEINP